MTDATSTRDPEAIEQDIRKTQDDMSRTVERIGDQLSVQNVLESVLGKGEGGGIDTRKLLDAAKRNPPAVAMIAAGAVWLLSGQEAKLPSLGSMGSSGSSGSSDADSHDPAHRAYLAHISRCEPREGEEPSAYQRRRDQARADYFMVERSEGEDDSSFRQRLDQVAEGFRQKRSAFAEQTRQTRDQVSAGAGQAIDRGQELYDQNPWAGGLLAAVAGAVAGALLPLTRTEQEQLAGIGGKVREAAEEQKDRLTSELRERKDDLVDKAADKLNQAATPGWESEASSGSQEQGSASFGTGAPSTTGSSGAVSPPSTFTPLPVT